MPLVLDPNRWLPWDDPRTFRHGYRYRGTGFTLFLYKEYGHDAMMLVVRDRWGTEAHHHVLDLQGGEAGALYYWDEGKEVAEEMLNAVAKSKSLDIPGA